MRRACGGQRHGRVRQATVGQPGNAPPIADLGWSCTALDCTFTDASADGDGGIMSWLWDFGDGETASVQNGQRVKTTENDGKHTTVHQFTGTATWRVKAYQAGSTTVCSPERSITLSN